jgi:hypothetical protein
MAGVGLSLSHHLDQSDFGQLFTVVTWLYANFLTHAAACRVVDFA